MCNDYMIYQVTTQMELGNLTGEVVQVEAETPVRGADELIDGIEH